MHHKCNTNGRTLGLATLPTREAAKLNLGRLLEVSAKLTDDQDKQKLGFAANCLQTVIAADVVPREAKS